MTDCSEIGGLGIGTFSPLGVVIAVGFSIALLVTTGHTITEYLTVNGK